MKHITKKIEPIRFTKWKEIYDVPGAEFSSLSGQPKKELHQSLVQEQGQLCCYCERRIEEENSHIEHFCPQKGQNGCHDRILDYQNLHASCQKELEKKEPRHCGMGKGDWFDENLLISPLDAGCEQRFKFTGDGKIFPAEHKDAAARETIKRLGLDIPKLRALRSMAVHTALTDYGDLSSVEINLLVSQSNNGQLIEYGTTIRYVLT